MQAAIWLFLGCMVQVATGFQVHRLFAYHNQISERARRDERSFGIPPRLDYGAGSTEFATAFCFFGEDEDAEADATTCGED